jgi:hypothetical protein
MSFELIVPIGAESPAQPYATISMGAPLSKGADTWRRSCSLLLRLAHELEIANTACGYK